MLSPLLSLDIMSCRVVRWQNFSWTGDMISTVRNLPIHIIITHPPPPLNNYHQDTKRETLPLSLFCQRIIQWKRETTWTNMRFVCMKTTHTIISTIIIIIGRKIKTKLMIMKIMLIDPIMSSIWREVCLRKFRIVSGKKRERKKRE